MFRVPCLSRTGAVLAAGVLLFFCRSLTPSAQGQVCLTVLPEIHDIQPDPAPAGSTIAITGMMFQPPPCLYDVTVGGVSTGFAWMSYNTIAAIVPPGLADGTYDVKVHIHGGGTSAPYPLDVLGPPPPCGAPQIVEVVPLQGSSGSPVTIQGTDFLPPPCLTGVTFRGEPSPSFAWLNDTTIVATVPDIDTGPAAIQVLQLEPDPDSNVYEGFFIDNGGYLCLAALPQINSVTPLTAPPGAVVTITGMLFQAPPCLYDVTFRGTSSPAFAWLNGNTILAMVPSITPGQADVKVHIRVGGTSTAYTNFSVLDPLIACNLWPFPLINDIVSNPTEPYAMVEIQGEGFAPPPCLLDVTFDGASSYFVWLDDTTIQAQVPGDVLGDVQVVVHQENTTAEFFPLTVEDPIPVCMAVLPNITDILPGGGSPLTEITISGSGFQAEPCLYAVTFNGVPTHEFTYVNSTTITAEVPLLPPGPAQVRVHCHVGGTSEPYYFLVLPPSVGDLECTATIAGPGTVGLAWNNMMRYDEIGVIVDDGDDWDVDADSLEVGPASATLEGLDGGTHEICVEARLMLAVHVPVTSVRVCCEVTLPCPADTDGNGVVDVNDLVEIILGWGPCPPGPCPADVDENGTVDVNDLVELIVGWGDC